MPSGVRFAPTLANPLGAQQVVQTPAAAGRQPADKPSIDSIVTAVRMFSETLLANGVSKEAQQEVKILTAQLEVLLARRRLAASRARCPSDAESQLALRNLKRFLEREATRERRQQAMAASHSNKPSVSCTTDTLESSCSQVQVFSSVSDRTQSSHSGSSVDEEEGNACGTKVGGRTMAASLSVTAMDRLKLPNCRHRGKADQSSQPLPPQVPPPELSALSPAKAKAEWREAKLQQQHNSSKAFAVHLQEERTRKPLEHPRRLLGPAQQVELVCSEPLILLPPFEVGEAPKPALQPSFGAADATATGRVRDCGVATHQRSRTPPPLLLLLEIPVRVERAPLTVLNCQLEELPLPRLELAVERLTTEAPLLTAEPVLGLRGGCGWGCVGSQESRRSGLSSNGDCSYCGCAVVEKALLAEQQGNLNCVSVSTRMAVVGWARQAATTTSASGDQISEQNRMSTCSCPSDSDGRRGDYETGADAGKKPLAEQKAKATDDSVDIQTSSALIQQTDQQRQQCDSTKRAATDEISGCQNQAQPVAGVPKAATTKHTGIQPSRLRLLQRVCESSSSPERLDSSAAGLLVAAVGLDGDDADDNASDVDDCGWPHRPLLRIVDLLRLATPLARSGSPREAPEVVASPTEATGVGRVRVWGNSDRSNSTLEVVDQSGAGSRASDAGTLPPAAAQVVAALATTATATLGRTTWSSCEVGQSSGFTKLLLTLDRAAKRRRLRKKFQQQQLQQQQQQSQKKQQPETRRSRRNSQSGNISGCHPNEGQHQQRKQQKHEKLERSLPTSQSGNNSSYQQNRCQHQQHSRPKPQSKTRRSRRTSLSDSNIAREQHQRPQKKQLEARRSRPTSRSGNNSSCHEGQRHPQPTELQQPQRQQLELRRSRPTSRSGNNSSRHGGHHSQLQRLHQNRHQRLPAAERRSPSDETAKRRQQAAALRLAAKSLSVLSQSLQQCVQSVQDAAEAINCSL